MMHDITIHSQVKNHFELVHDNSAIIANDGLAESMYELNNLLSIVLSNANIAMSKLAISSPARDNLERVQQAAEQLADLLLQMNFKLHDDDYIADVSNNWLI